MAVINLPRIHSNRVSVYEEPPELWAVTGSEDTDLSELRLLELYRTHVAQC